jgi:hypothetical protein
MLQLHHNGQPIQTVREGSTIRLPNGDYLSPALAGWSYGDFSLEPYEAPPEPPAPVETIEEWRSYTEVSQFQAHATLELWGLYGQAQALAETIGGLVQIGFQRASVWRRASPTVNSLFANLTMLDGSPVTAEVVDEFFRQAATIEL